MSEETKRPQHMFTDAVTNEVSFVDYTDEEMEDLRQRQETARQMEAAEQKALAAIEATRAAVEDSVKNTVSVADIQTAKIAPEVRDILVSMQKEIEGLQRQLGLLSVNDDDAKTSI